MSHVPKSLWRSRMMGEQSSSGRGSTRAQKVSLEPTPQKVAYSYNPTDTPVVHSERKSTRDEFGRRVQPFKRRIWPSLSGPLLSAESDVGFQGAHDEMRPHRWALRPGFAAGVDEDVRRKFEAETELANLIQSELALTGKTWRRHFPNRIQGLSRAASDSGVSPMDIAGLSDGACPTSLDASMPKELTIPAAPRSDPPWSLAKPECSWRQSQPRAEAKAPPEIRPDHVGERRRANLPSSRR